MNDINGNIMINHNSSQLSKLTVLLQYTDKIIDETNNLMIDANQKFGQVKDFIIQTEQILNPSVKKINTNNKSFIQKIKKHLFLNKDKTIDSSSIMDQLKKHYECSNIENVLLSMKIIEKKMLEAKIKCLDLFQSNQKEIQLFTDSAKSLNCLHAKLQKNEYQNTNSLIKTETSQEYTYLKDNDNNPEQLLLDFETKQQILHNLTVSINLILDNFMVLLSKTSDFISNGTTHKALEIKTILDKMMIEV